jgi:hypothetical protein
VTYPLKVVSNISPDWLIRLSWNFGFLPKYVSPTYCKNISQIVDIDWATFGVTYVQCLIYINICGWIHGDPATFWKVLFFHFFPSKMPVCSRKHFWWKKTGSFLLKIPSSGAVFGTPMGESMETHRLFRKSFFFDFFPSKMPECSRKHFW